LTALFQRLTLQIKFYEEATLSSDEHDWRTSFRSSCDWSRWSESTSLLGHDPGSNVNPGCRALAIRARRCNSSSSPLNLNILIRLIE